MSLPHKVWCHLAIGLTVLGLFIIAIGILLRILSTSSSDFTEKTRSIGAALTIIGSVIIVIAKVLLICSLKFKSPKERTVNQLVEKPINKKKSLELPHSNKHNFEHQMSCSVSTPNWSYHSRDDLKSSQQLLKEEKVGPCPLQSDQEKAL
jgi:hypothetical protein